MVREARLNAERKLGRTTSWRRAFAPAAEAFVTAVARGRCARAGFSPSAKDRALPSHSRGGSADSFHLRTSGAAFPVGRALGVDPYPALDRTRAPAQVRRYATAAWREVDGSQRSASRRQGPLEYLPDEGAALDASRSVVSIVALDVVDDVVAGARLDTPGMVGDAQQLANQWKYWPPSITMVWPVMNSDPGPQRNTPAPTTSAGTWSRCSVRAATETSRS